MTAESTYSIVFFPTRKIVRPHCTLREAAAWLATYNTIMQGAGPTATIVEEEEERREEESEE